MAWIKCTHCDAVSDPIKTAGYCDACGKKLHGYTPIAPSPQRISSGPARYGSKPPPTMLEARLWGTLTLLVVACFQVMCGGRSFLLFAIMGMYLDRATKRGGAVANGDLDSVLSLTLVTAGELGLGIILVPLGIWAAFHPRIPTLLGACLYLLLLLGASLAFFIVVKPELNYVFVSVIGVKVLLLGLLLGATYRVFSAR